MFTACVRCRVCRAEIALISAVPDDVAALVTLQVVTGALVGVLAPTLLAVSALFGLLQGKD